MHLNSLNKGMEWNEEWNDDEWNGMEWKEGMNEWNEGMDTTNGMEHG